MFFLGHLHNQMVFLDPHDEFISNGEWKTIISDQT